MGSAGRTLAASLLLLSIAVPLAAQNRVLADIPIELAYNKTIIPVRVGHAGPLCIILDSGMPYDGILLFDTAKVDRTAFANLAQAQIGGAGGGGASGAMTWTDYIHADPALLGGEPVIAGTRLAVDSVLGLLAEGWTRDELRANYPQVTDDALRAVFAYAAEVLQDQTLLATRPGAA